jgi:4-aminobutyrate aminotransferase/(S)-3-amino-2-methylpropionate transaminase
MKAAFLQRQARKRSDPGKFSKEEVESVMNNAAVSSIIEGVCADVNADRAEFDWKQPGSPDLSVISFKGGFHGRMLGSLSATRSKAIHKVDACQVRSSPCDG